MTNFLQYYLPVFLLGYLLVAFVLPSVRVYRQTGINPVTFSKRDNAHDYIGLVMKILTGLLIVSVVLFSVSEDLYAYIVPIWYLQEAWLQYAGLFFLHSALIWIIIAQAQMNQSWRIGIDENNKTALVEHGLFSISRNPIFLGMILSTVGLFLVLPSALTFFVAAASYIVIQIQIRLEEDFLTKEHGQTYLDYKAKVRRLV